MDHKFTDRSRCFEIGRFVETNALIEVNVLNSVDYRAHAHIPIEVDVLNLVDALMVDALKDVLRSYFLTKNRSKRCLERGCFPDLKTPIEVDVLRVVGSLAQTYRSKELS